MIASRALSERAVFSMLFSIGQLERSFGLPFLRLQRSPQPFRNEVDDL